MRFAAGDLRRREKNLLKFGRQTSLDLYCPRFLPWRGYQEIDFGAGRRTIEVGRCTFRGWRDQYFDYKAFPTETDN